MVLMRDFLESVDDRGRAAPGAVKSPLITRPEATGAPWPLDNPPVCVAARVESGDIPKHAPPMWLGAIKKLESTALNVAVGLFKRDFATGVLLMTYASLRCSGVQTLRILEANVGPSQGTPMQSKTKKPPGIPRPWATHRMGASGSTNSVSPLIDFQDARGKRNGAKFPFTFAMLSRMCELEKAGPSAYSITRRKLALDCSAPNDPDGETYAMRHPENFLPTSATQMNFATLELNLIGQWSIN